MVKAKAAAADMKVPQNLDEAAAMIAEFGAVARDIERLDTELKEKLQKEKLAAEAKAAPLIKQAETIFAGIKLFCEANRRQLLANSGTKTVEFTSGTVSWRFKPPKVTLSGDVNDIVERVFTKATVALDEQKPEVAASFRNFLRVSTEIDKEAMLKNPDLARTIEGVKIGRGGEVFEVEPFAPGLAEAAQ